MSTERRVLEFIAAGYEKGLTFDQVVTRAKDTLTVTAGTKLGDWIVPRHRLRRVFDGTLNSSTRTWIEDALPGCQPWGLVVGRRLLSNGTVTYNADEGDVYKATEHFWALLVVTDIRRKPFYIREGSEL